MKKIGFTNGCFDILHVGHLKLIEYCKSFCDHLIIGIDSDIMVQTAKGPDRPFNFEHDRKYFLENIKNVDEVFIFNSHKELEQKIKKIQPDIMIVGSDYRNKLVVGSEFAKQLKFFDKIDGYSTTKILQNITDRG